MPAGKAALRTPLGSAAFFVPGSTAFFVPAGGVADSALSPFGSLAFLRFIGTATGFTPGFFGLVPEEADERTGGIFGAFEGVRAGRSGALSRATLEPRRTNVRRVFCGWHRTKAVCQFSMSDSMNASVSACEARCATASR